MTTPSIETIYGPLPDVRTQGTRFSLPDDLMPHQVEDIARILNSHTPIMNLSEMGTGKTPVAIGVAEMGGFQNVLVLVPKPLRLEWKLQIQEWTESRIEVCMKGASRRLNPLFEALKRGEAPKYFILNYDTMRLDRLKEIITEYPWDLIIEDEAHQIRNDRTTTTRGLLEFLTENSKAKVLPMTGSPVVNSGLDMYTILMTTDPLSFTTKNRHVFLDEYFYWTTGRERPKIFALQRPTAYYNFMDKRTIQRKKKDVLKDLPEKYYRRTLLEMEDDQREIYDNMLENLIIELDSEEGNYFAGSILAQLTRLRQLNLDPRILGLDKSSSKTDFILDMIDSGPDKLVIFSTFAQYIDILAEELRKREVEFVSITGKTDSDKIVALSQKFQNDPSVKVAIGTHKVMGQGIDLYAAQDVILADRWWTPTANNQAVDRLHRKGQKNAVQVITLTNDGSVDAVLDAVIERKALESDLMLNEATTIEEVLQDLRYTLTSRSN